MGAEGLGDLDEGLGGEAVEGEGEGAAIEDDVDLGAGGVGGDAAGELAALATGDGAGPALGGEVGGELADEVAGLGVEVEAAVEGGADVGGFEMRAGEHVDGAGVVVTLDEGGDEGVDFGEEFEIALAVLFVGFHLALLVLKRHAGDLALEAGLPLFDHAEEGAAGFELFAGLLDVCEGGAELGDVGGVARLEGGADECEVGLVAVYEGAVEGEPFEGGGRGGGGCLPGVGEVLLEVFELLRAEEGVSKVPFGEAVDEEAEDFFVGGVVTEGAEGGAEAEVFGHAVFDFGKEGGEAVELGGGGELAELVCSVLFFVEHDAAEGSIEAGPVGGGLEEVLGFDEFDEFGPGFGEFEFFEHQLPCFGEAGGDGFFAFFVGGDGDAGAVEVIAIGGGELDGAGLAALSAFAEQPADGISYDDGGGDGADEAGAAGEEAAADAAAIKEAFGEAHFIDDFGVVGEALFGAEGEHAIDDVLGAG